MKNLRNANAAKVVLGMLMGTFALTAAANAQPAFLGKFVLPQEVRWNQAVLPAGEYTIEMDSLHGIAVLHSKTTNTTYYSAVPMISAAEEGAARLDITVQGNDRVVRTLNAPGIGHALIFTTLNAAQKENLAHATRTESVPVFAARK